MRDYELKVITPDGKRSTVEMSGNDGEHAAMRYADLHRGTTVLAWREPRHGIFVLGNGRIIQ